MESGLTEGNAKIEDKAPTEHLYHECKLLAS